MAPFTLSVRALSGGATLEVDGADTIATVKKKFDAALVEIGQESMKGLSLWHENARLDESRTLQSYGVGAGAVIQALTTERDVEAALREEREAEEQIEAMARRLGWKASYGCCVSKAEGERRRQKAIGEARHFAPLEAEIRPEYEAARANGAPNDTVRDATEGERGERVRRGGACDARARATLPL